MGAGALRPVDTPERKALGGLAEEALQAVSSTWGLWIGREEERQSNQRDQGEGKRTNPSAVSEGGASLCTVAGEGHS